LNTLDSFCKWLAASAVSQTIQSVEWVIPTVQTIHILAVAAVMSSVLFINLRLLGLGARELTIASAAKRFLPFIWWPLPILLATGATLIVAEPARALQNPVFLLKMGLLIAAMAITLASQIPLQRDATFWDRDAGRRRAAGLIAVASLPLWIGIVFAGRWIAYFQGA
jgi:hypothetical protein